MGGGVTAPDPALVCALCSKQFTWLCLEGLREEGELQVHAISCTCCCEMFPCNGRSSATLQTHWLPFPALFGHPMDLFKLYLQYIAVSPHTTLRPIIFVLCKADTFGVLMEVKAFSCRKYFTGL